MIKRLLFVFTVVLSTTPFQAQTSETTKDLNCFNKWAAKFEERGAEEVKDGVYTDVIITSRIGGGVATCYSGKAEVLNKKLLRCYIVREDGTYEEVKRLWKNNSNKEVAINNGMSSSMLTAQNEIINVLWPQKIKPKKAAFKKAPDPTDD